MAPRKSAMALRPFEGSLADPLTDLCIITPQPRPDAGPCDRVEPSHAACEKYERELSPEFIANVKARGVIEPIVGLKDGRDRYIVVAGRRRTRAARAANAEIDAENAALPPGTPPRPRLLVRVVRASVAEDDVLGVRGLLYSENTQREDYTPTQKAQELADFQALGADLPLLCQTFGLKPAAVKAHLALLDCAAEVRAAVDGGLSVTAAAALSELPRAEQVARLGEARTAKRGASVRAVLKVVRAARRGEAAGEALRADPPSRRVLKLAVLGARARLEKTSDATDRTAILAVAVALRWAATGKDSIRLKLGELVALGRQVSKDGTADEKET